MDTTFPLAVKIDGGDVVLTLDTVRNFDSAVGNFDSETTILIGGVANADFVSILIEMKGFAM